MSMWAYFPGYDTPLAVSVRGLSEDFDIGVATVDLPGESPETGRTRSAGRDFRQLGGFDRLPDGSRGDPGAGSIEPTLNGSRSQSETTRKAWSRSSDAES